MIISEIFMSLQGEGIYTGIPMVFVRLQGCNIKCSYCDTVYARSRQGGSVMEVREVVESIDDFVGRETKPNLSHINWVCITGGEPLLQGEEVGELVGILRKKGYWVEIETNGTIPPPVWYLEVSSWVVDCKVERSEVLEFGWFRALRFQDQVKFVINGYKDTEINRVLDTINNFSRPHILISPILKPGVYINTGILNMFAKLVEVCVANNLRLSPQLHKLIGIR